MTQFFLKIYDFLSKRRRITAAFLLAFMAVCAFLMTQITYEEDIAKFLPKNEQNARLTEIYQQLNQQNRIAILFSSTDDETSISADSIVLAMDAFAANIEEKDTSEMVKDLMIQTDEMAIFDVLTFAFEHAPYLLTNQDLVKIDSLLQQKDFVNQQMAENKRMLQLPGAGLTMQNLQYDPLHLFTPVLQRLRQSQGNNFQIVDGRIFTADGKHALATFTSPYGSSETANNNRLAQFLAQIIELTQQQYPTVSVSAVGAPLIAVSNASRIKKDSLLAMTVAVVLILILLLLHYRRLSDLLWLGTSIVFGWLFAIAGMWIFKDSISVIVLGIGSVIIGIAVNYPLHYLDHLMEVKDQREALREMVPPLLIGNITTVAAFFCLVWLDAAAMRDLGLFGSFMLIGTILFVLVFLPLFAKAHRLTDARFDVKLDFLKLNTTRRRRAFVLIVTLLTLIFSWFSSKTSFDADLRHINYLTPAQEQAINLLSSSANSASMYVVSEGKTLEEALQTNEQKVVPLLEKMEKTKQISGSQSVSNVLLTQEAQKERLDAWDKFWESRRATLLSQFRTACSTQGFNESAFQPFIDLLSNKQEPLPLEDFDVLNQSLAQTFIQKSDSVTRVISAINPDEMGENDIKAQFESLASPSVYAFSSKDVSNQLVKVLSDSFNYVGWVCGFVVFFFLWFSFGKIELALLSFLPLAVSWIWILGLMQIFGVQFNIVNIILATFIFGQGDDYTIFITEGLVYEYATGRERLQSYKRSVALSAVIMFIGIGSLIIARHPALRSLAYITIIGMFTVVLMAFYLPPICFRWLTMKNGVRRAVPLTLKRVVYSLYALICFLICMFCVLVPITRLLFFFGKNTPKTRKRYHKLLQKISGFALRRVPGVKCFVENAQNENFERPAVIICNHQSHLDLMCLMMLTPKIVFMTNDWAWNNPLYSYVIHRAEFLPASKGMEQNMEQLRDLYNRGYSIAIFPEGTRSTDCSILRFHKGAFYLAQQLKADILPIFLHGAGYVLPKNDFMLREGKIHVDIQPRLSAENALLQGDLLTQSKQVRAYYKQHYAEMCAKYEDEAYHRLYQHYADYYKCGIQAEEGGQS